MPRKSPRDGGDLAALVAAIGKGDFPAALAHALAAWRAARGVELADLVDAIGARCRAATIAARDAQTFHAAWMRLATGKPSPVAIGALAATVGRNVPVAKTRNYIDRDIRRHAAFLDRVAALAGQGDDPRIAAALIDILEKAPYTIESGHRIYQPAIDLIVRIADARSVARLRALVATPRTRAALVRAYFARALPVAADAIEKRAPAAPSAETAAILDAAITALAPAAKPAPRGDVDQLIAECLAQPDDDGPREVLADVLQERGDPRGEFITLQLREARGALSAPERTQLNKLLRTHEKTWLGELAIVTKHRVWRRGFLDEVELARNAAAPAATWERTVMHPALASVRRLAKGAANATHYERFIGSPITRALREIAVLDPAMIDLVRQLEKPVEHLIIEGPTVTPETQRALRELLARRPIQRLTVPTRAAPQPTIALLATLPERARIGELVARPALRATPLWSAGGETWLAAFETLAPIRRLGIDFDPNGTIVVEPAKRGSRVVIEARTDWIVAWAIEHLRCTELVLGGARPSGSTTRANLATLLRSVGRVELREGWAELADRLTDRDRARRARRS